MTDYNKANKQWHDVVLDNEDKAIKEGKTILHMSVIFDNQEECSNLQDYIMAYNGIQDLKKGYSNDS